MTTEKAGSERWLIASYRPTAMFSLRMTHATSKGGKTLLVPTPYAVKLALIDACFRLHASDEGYAHAARVYEMIKARKIRFCPPEHCVVQQTFIKIKQQEKNAPRGIFASNIAYREFCYFSGDLAVALDINGLEEVDRLYLTELFPRVNYLGKRGSFMQFISCQTWEGPLPRGYTCPESEADIANGGYASTNYLDDFSEALVQDKDGFERINSYSGKPSSLKYRALVRTLLPYRQVSSGKHFTYYKRLPG
ncbi:MAG: hypothetical protein GX890_02180 [Firmicutes bacterium]|jgi:hypothetical protein|nr:hypothetical protein [Bacillota bacterium]HPU00992.1 hypothetical protein [Bacillota bacterium]